METVPPRFESVTIKEIGVFDDVRIDFKPIASLEADAKKAELHLFTGPNGCGKSTLLYALAHGLCPPSDMTMHRVLNGRVRSDESRVEFKFEGRGGAMLRQVRENSTVTDVVTTFGALTQAWGHSGIWYAQQKERGERSVKGGLYAHLMNIEERRHNATGKARFRMAAFAYAGQRSLSSFALDGIREIEQSPFAEALAFNGTVRNNLLVQWIANAFTKKALAESENLPDEARRYTSALSRVEAFVSEVIEAQAVKFRLLRQPSLHVALQVNGRDLSLDALPDGLKSIISWVADMAMRLDMIPWENPTRDIFAQPIILFLDEIDIHLHPHWQRRILPAVQKLLPNAQIFASTHSPFVIGSVQDAWVYQLPQPEPGKGVSGRIDGIPSGAGKSVHLILKEIFDVPQEFDTESEALLDRFYESRDQALNAAGRDAELIEIGETLSARGTELKLIVESELRQVSRLTKRELSLAPV